jgi:hypothetical protein
MGHLLKENGEVMQWGHLSTASKDTLRQVRGLLTTFHQFRKHLIARGVRDDMQLHRHINHPIAASQDMRNVSTVTAGRVTGAAAKQNVIMTAAESRYYGVTTRFMTLMMSQSKDTDLSSRSIPNLQFIIATIRNAHLTQPSLVRRIKDSLIGLWSEEPDMQDRVIGRIVTPRYAAVSHFDAKHRITALQQSLPSLTPRPPRLSALATESKDEFIDIDLTMLPTSVDPFDSKVIEEHGWIKADYGHYHGDLIAATLNAQMPLIIATINDIVANVPFLERELGLIFNLDAIVDRVMSVLARQVAYSLQIGASDDRFTDRRVFIHGVFAPRPLGAESIEVVDSVIQAFDDALTNQLLDYMSMLGATPSRATPMAIAEMYMTMVLNSGRLAFLYDVGSEIRASTTLAYLAGTGPLTRETYSASFQYLHDVEQASKRGKAIKKKSVRYLALRYQKAGSETAYQVLRPTNANQIAFVGLARQTGVFSPRTMPGLPTLDNIATLQAYREFDSFITQVKKMTTLPIKLRRTLHPLYAPVYPLTLSASDGISDEFDDRVEAAKDVYEDIQEQVSDSETLTLKEIPVVNRHITPDIQLQYLRTLELAFVDATLLVQTQVAHFYHDVAIQGDSSAALLLYKAIRKMIELNPKLLITSDLDNIKSWAENVREIVDFHIDCEFPFTTSSVPMLQADGSRIPTLIWPTILRELDTYIETLNLF